MSQSTDGSHSQYETQKRKFLLKYQYGCKNLSLGQKSPNMMNFQLGLCTLQELVVECIEN